MRLRSLGAEVIPNFNVIYHFVSDMEINARTFGQVFAFGGLPDRGIELQQYFLSILFINRHAAV